MSKVLFVNQPTMGHLNTLLSIGLQMREDGHEVRYLMPGIKKLRVNLPLAILRMATSLPAYLSRYDLPVDILTVAPRTIFPAIQLPRFMGFEETKAAINFFSLGMTFYSQQVSEYLDGFQPDIVVADFAFPAACLAAEKANIPYAIVYHSGLPFSGPQVPPFGSGLPIGTTSGPMVEAYRQQTTVMNDTLNARFRQSRLRLGLPINDGDMNYLGQPQSPWLNLITSIEAIEAERDSLTETTFFIGPCIGGRRGTPTNFPFDRLRESAFKIYVSLGTVFNDRPEVFKAIIDGLDTPGYQVIISAGAAYPKLAQLNLPAHVMLFQQVPQADLLPKIDLVIGHGGNNSTNETLAAGKPLIVLPVGGEQGDNASRIEYLGAGLRADIHQLSAQKIRELVTSVQANRAIQARVLELKAAIDETNGVRAASALIGQVAATQSPLIRPVGMGLTVTKQSMVFSA